MKARPILGLMMLAFSAVAAAEPLVRGTANVYDFDQDSAGKPPSGFTFARTRRVGKEGQWQVEAQTDAPSGGQVLRQLLKDATRARYPVAVTTSVFHSDIRVEVKCKTVSGAAAQACGVVVRYVDENNYYVARANVLEDAVGVYHVKKGQRTQLGAWTGKVAAGAWNALAVEAKGDRLRVHFNGAQVIDVRDRTLRAGGKAGVVTEADSVAYFDDFVVTSL